MKERLSRLHEAGLGHLAEASLGDVAPSVAAAEDDRGISSGPVSLATALRADAACGVAW